VLEAAARLGEGRRLPTAARGAARPSAAAAQAGHVTRGHRLLQRAGAEKGGRTGPNPTDRSKSGSKHHLLIDRRGNPLAVDLTAANVNDVGHLLPLLDAVPPIRGRVGRPVRRPKKLHADKGYASRTNRRALSLRGISPRIARPGMETSQKLGRHRWRVEQRLAHLHSYRHLRIRDDRRDDIHLAFLRLACALMTFRSLHPYC
jgi:IS5 family transposase